MQNSIEARSPFLDHELFEYTNSIPHKFKIKKGSSKLVLRKFLKNNLNNNIYKNPKKGFTVPLAHWINNEIKDLILDTFNKKRSNELSFLNMDYFKKNILKPHIEGITNNHKKIWNVFILLRWIDNNISK
jgi:asparagine synthase (glutamine-hydrolysing)